MKLHPIQERPGLLSNKSSHAGKYLWAILCNAMGKPQAK